MGVVQIPQDQVVVASLKRAENGIYYGLTHDRRKVQFRSVTSALQVISKDEALINWAVRVMGEYISKHAAVGLPLTIEHRDALIAEGRKEHNRQKYEAAGIGTRVHELIKMWLKRQPLPPLHSEDERVQNCLSRFWDWWEGKRLRVVRVEFPVCNARAGYAGTLDFLCQLENGMLALLDWKTSNFVHVEFYLQVAAYLMALIRMGWEAKRFAEITILRIGRTDAYFEPVPISMKAARAAYQAFRCCLQLCTELGRLKTIENKRRSEYQATIAALEAGKDSEETQYAF